jgi:hypothetical protein
VLPAGVGAQEVGVGIWGREGHQVGEHITMM